MFNCLQTGTCALFFAAQGGFLDIVRLLLDHGVPVDIPSYVCTLYVQKLCIFHPYLSVLKSHIILIFLRIVL